MKRRALEERLKIAARDEETSISTAPKRKKKSLKDVRGPYLLWLSTSDSMDPIVSEWRLIVAQSCASTSADTRSISNKFKSESEGEDNSPIDFSANLDEDEDVAHLACV